MSEKQEPPPAQQPVMNQQQMPSQQPAVSPPVPQQNPAVLQVSQQQQQGQTWPATQQHVVVQMSTRRPPVVIQNYNSAKSRALGISQLVFGVSAVVLNIIGIIIHATAHTEYYDGSHYYRSYYWDESYAYYVGTGIWCSILVILSASFAVCAGRRKTKCMIVTHLVFAILGSIFAGIMLCHACWAVGQDSNRLENGFDLHGYRNYHHNNDYDYQDDYYYRTMYASKSAARAKGSLFISILFMLVSLGSFITCIWSSTLCCKVLCCATNRSTPSVQYVANPTGQSQMVILGGNGQTVLGPPMVQNPGTTYITQPGLNPAFIPQMGQIQGQMIPAQGAVAQQAYPVQQMGAPQPLVMGTAPPAYQQ